MEQGKDNVPTDETGEAVEAFLGWGDIALLVIIAILGIYWLFFRNRKPAESPTKSFSIAPTSVPARVNDRNFVSKMKNSGRSMVVFYGSQTGTAEEFANRLMKDAKRYGMKAMVADPEECEMEDLGEVGTIENNLSVFCMATYGEGDPTDNAQEFYDWLQNGGSDLNGLNYAVFGLGNKTYEHYNAMGKFVDKKLSELGAIQVFELGLGDDDGNMEEDFITWKEKFWQAVCEHFGLEASAEELNVRQFRLSIHQEIPSDRVFVGEPARLHSFTTQRPPFDAKNPYMAPLVELRELHKGGGRSCMHIELNVEGSRIRYEAGDHVAVFPTNNNMLVERLAQLTGTDLDIVISLVNVDDDSHKKHPFPCPCSYRTAFLHYVDISSAPRTHVLKELAEYCSDEKEKEMLRGMAQPTPEGKEAYQRWILDACRNIVHVLEDMPSCKPALDHLCELLPRLQARYYSISSSPKVHPTRIHITAVVVEYETPTHRVNKGVATTWLREKKPLIYSDNGHPAPLVPMFVRKSAFRLPARPQTPVIMVGPGTGLAPFRGFIQERHNQKQEGKPVGQTVLFYGCRKQAEDYLYESELSDYVSEGTLELHVAFSRDKPEKVYVQHLLAQCGESIWKLLEDGAHFYVCGDARNMSRDVHATLVRLVKEHGNMSEGDAITYVKKLETRKRYQADVWS